MLSIGDYYEMREFREEGYHMAVSLDSASRVLINYIEEIKKQVSPSIKAYQDWMNGEKENHILQQKIDGFRQSVRYLLTKISINRDVDYKQHLSLEWYSQFTNKEDTNWLLKLLGKLDKNWGVCMLNALENDVLLSTSICIDWVFFYSTSSCCFGCDQISALAVPNRFFVLEGQDVSTTFLIGSFARRGKLTITATNVNTIFHETNYIATVATKARELGINKLSGTVTWRWGRDSMSRQWSTEFFVAAKGCQMQLDKANVCYVGVPNPVSLSVPGYPETALNLRVPGAEVKKLSDGHFEIFIANQPSKPFYAFVDATNKQGRTSAVASLKIITKNLPDPVARLGNLEGNTITITDARSANAIHIRQVDNDFDMAYNLVSFELSVMKKKERKLEGPIIAGALDAGEIKQIISNLEPGDKIYVEEVKAKDAAGRLVDVLPVSYAIK